MSAIARTRSSLIVGEPVVLDGGSHAQAPARNYFRDPGEPHGLYRQVREST